MQFPLLLLATALLGSSLVADAATPLLPGGRYALASRVLLPHLDEMHRHVDEHTRCLATDDIRGLFPVLRQPALKGCHFGHPQVIADGMRYVLVCHSARVATGSADLRRAKGMLIGDLRVKMGGKNMTFSQRVEARRLADCDAVPAVER